MQNEDLLYGGVLDSPVQWILWQRSGDAFHPQNTGILKLSAEDNSYALAAA